MDKLPEMLLREAIGERVGGNPPLIPLPLYLYASAGSTRAKAAAAWAVEISSEVRAGAT